VSRLWLWKSFWRLDTYSNKARTRKPNEAFARTFSRGAEVKRRRFTQLYGETGLLKIFLLASTHDAPTFGRFRALIGNDMSFRKTLWKREGPDLACDNDRLRQAAALSRFRWNVVQPSLSRKLYNPGRHHGWLTYGLGGPRILVSHPSQGIRGEAYDVYNNSIDVATSLWMKGFTGTFLFLDYLPGLNFEMHGVPAWVLWFSLIAVHSDLVLFVKEYGKDFDGSQKMEIEFTSDRVQTKTVEIPHEELKWAKKSKHGKVTSYIKDGKVITKEEYYSYEAREAEPLIKGYERGDFPADGSIRIDESGEIAEFPFNYPAYKHSKSL
jgi:hypothetical protein